MPKSPWKQIKRAACEARLWAHFFAPTRTVGTAVETLLLSKRSETSEWGQETPL